MKQIIIATAIVAISCSTVLAERSAERKAKIDKNGDGKISHVEHKKARHAYLQNRNEVDKKWEERADKNDDGVIGKKELHHARQQRKNRS